jgi:hypothetical protein
MAKEEIKLRLPVVPELDKRGTSNLLRDIKRLQSDLGKVDVSWKSIAKTASLNVKELNKISSGASSLGKALSDAAKSAYKELGGLGKELESAQDKAKALAKSYSGAKGGAKADIGKDISKQMKLITDLNKQIDIQKDRTKKYNSELERGLKAQQKNVASLKQTAAYSPKDALVDMLGKVKSGDIKGMFGTLNQAMKGAQARGAVAKGEATGGAAGASQMAAAGESMAMASAGMAAGAAAIMAFVKLIMAASQHMADLNKGLTSGIPLAQEMGGHVGDYSKAIKNLRNAAIDSAGAMLKFGLKSEDALVAVNSFAKQSGMSMAQMEIQLRDMGQGDLDRGMREFAINAQVYGKALGMEAKDVAGLMGQFVNEIGISADSVSKTMGDIVKQAAQSGMPVQKFMDIFHQAIPNLDLFTNRIEELTGVMKMLSKTMDPRAVKGFMSAMGKGFDQMDFKQRLKMALVIGPGEMGRIMKDDIGRATAAVKDGLKNILSPKEIDAALKGPNSIKAMRALAAKAMAKGATGAQVSELNRLGRYKELQGGGVLKQASGMREMGLMGRMEALQDLAGKFTGGDISGLGEHVAKQLGVSEEEYKAILGMQDSLGDYSSSIEQVGRTSSVSMNKALQKAMKDAGMNVPDDVQSDDFEKATKLAMKKDPAKMKKMIMLASTMQVEQAQADAKADAEAKESIEDLTADQIDATLSIGDKIENVIGFLLEKLYFVFDDVFGTLNSLYAALPGWLTGQYADTAKNIDKVTQMANRELKDNKEGLSYYQDMASKLKSIADRGGTTADYMREGNDLMMKQLHTDKADNKEYYDKVKNDLDGVFSDDDRNKFIKGLQTNDSKTTGALLKGLSPDKAAMLMAKLAKDQAKVEKRDLGHGDSKSPSKVAERMEKKQAAIAKLQDDHDTKTEKLMNDLVGETTDANKPPPGVPPASVATGRQAISTEVTRGPRSTQQATADNTADQLKTQEDAVKTADEQYEATTDTLSLLKKGIKFEDSWMKTKFRNVVKEASLDALRPALFESVLLQNRISKMPELGDYLASQAGNIASTGAAGLGAALYTTKGSNMLGKVQGYSEGQPFQTGITQVPHDMPAMLHAGEEVVSKANAGKGGGKNINVVIYAQGVPASQIAHHISNLSRSD